MIDTKIYQAFYTKSTPIVDYMVGKLSLEFQDKIFEPCGGDGVFVEAILKQNENAIIDVYELNDQAVETLNYKFSGCDSVYIKQCDTLLDHDLLFHSDFGGKYNKIIANPPYGAWQDQVKRSKLKKLYNNLYANETYGLFLYRCIKLLKEGGILTFIIPDTYLNLHMHKALRRYILTETKIVELALFPSSFFPGVNFGYANLSIITLLKVNDEQRCLNNDFKILSKFSSVEDLADIGKADLKVYSYNQSEIFANPDHAFLISDNIKVTNLINDSGSKIGDIANCVTGFYSGNDKAFLRPISSNLKYSKNYLPVDKETINDRPEEIKTILKGIDDSKCFVPIIKGGNTKYYKSNSWFMDWSVEAVENYKKGKRARFQNPKFYFKYGIGVPMISSSNITASLIDNKLFDQSIVGIFPQDPKLTYYLLAFFNSPTCNKLIRTINPSANNPSNYIKKIPFIRPIDEIIARINELVDNLIKEVKSSNNLNPDCQNELNEIIESIYGF